MKRKTAGTAKGYSSIGKQEDFRDYCRLLRQCKSSFGKHFISVWMSIILLDIIDFVHVFSSKITLID